MFYDNGYPNCFFYEVLNKFCLPYSTQNDDVHVSKKFILFDIPYVRKPFYRFYKNIPRLILKLSDVKVRPIYRTFKVGNSSTLKSYTASLLVCNVVDGFPCPYNPGKTCIVAGTSSRHMITSKREHLNLHTTRKTAVEDHLQRCRSCSESEINLHLSFTVLKKRSSEIIAKIHAALLIKESK